MQITIRMNYPKFHGTKYMKETFFYLIFFSFHLEKMSLIPYKPSWYWWHLWKHILKINRNIQKVYNVHTLKPKYIYKIHLYIYKIFTTFLIKIYECFLTTFFSLSLCVISLLSSIVLIFCEIYMYNFFFLNVIVL